MHGFTGASFPASFTCAQINVYTIRAKLNFWHASSQFYYSMQLWRKESELLSACRIVTKLVIKKKCMSWKKKNYKRKGRLCWVINWIGRRRCLGASAKLLLVLSAEDPLSYKNHLRMPKKHFDILLECVKPRIEKIDTHMRDSLPAKLKLEVTLRYLASGDYFTSLQYLYRVPKCTISKFLPEVCQAIYDALEDFY